MFPGRGHCRPKQPEMARGGSATLQRQGMSRKSTGVTGSRSAHGRPSDYGPQTPAAAELPPPSRLPWQLHRGPEAGTFASAPQLIALGEQLRGVRSAGVVSFECTASEERQGWSAGS